MIAFGNTISKWVSNRREMERMKDDHEHKIKVVRLDHEHEIKMMSMDHQHELDMVKINHEAEIKRIKNDGQIRTAISTTEQDTQAMVGAQPAKGKGLATDGDGLDGGDGSAKLESVHTVIESSDISTLSDSSERSNPFMPKKF